MLNKKEDKKRGEGSVIGVVSRLLRTVLFVLMWVMMFIGVKNYGWKIFLWILTFFVSYLLMLFLYGVVLGFVEYFRGK